MYCPGTGQHQINLVLMTKTIQTKKKIFWKAYDRCKAEYLFGRRDSSSDWIHSIQPPTQFHVLRTITTRRWHMYTFHEKNSPQLEFMLLIAAFENTQKIPLLPSSEKWLTFSSYCPSQVRNWQQKRKQPLYIPLLLCCFYRVIFYISCYDCHYRKAHIASYAYLFILLPCIVNIIINSWLPQS